MKPRYVMGGMGDVLLSLEDALHEKEINLYSHAHAAPRLLEPFGIRVRYEHFTDHTRVRPTGKPLPRRQYPVFPIPPASLARAAALPVRSRVIGLHPVGSAFSRQLGHRRGTPVKQLPVGVVVRLSRALDDGDTSILLFCAPGERAAYEGADSRLQIVAHEDPWDALACVTLCHRVVAVDSLIKTMSALLRIPTIVLLGDHRDRFRDKHFIRPYVRDGVMRVVRFTDPDLIDVSLVARMAGNWDALPREEGWLDRILGRIAGRQG